MQQGIIYWLDYDLWLDEKWILYNNQQPTRLVVGQRRSSKALPKAKPASKKGHGHYLVACCGCLIHYSFLKPLHLRSMLSKSMRCTENCSICSWHWSTEMAQFPMTAPECTSYNQHFKSWMNWAMKFSLICHIHLTSWQPTTASSSISKTFCRESTSITSRMQKMLSKRSSNPEAQIFIL